MNFIFTTGQWFKEKHYYSTVSQNFLVIYYLNMNGHFFIYKTFLHNQLIQFLNDSLVTYLISCVNFISIRKKAIIFYWNKSFCISNDELKYRYVCD